MRRILFAALMTIGLTLTSTPTGAADVQERSDGIAIPIGEGLLLLEPCAENIIRVAYAKNGSFFSHQSFAVLPFKSLKPSWKNDNPNQVTLSTSLLQARVDLTNGAVTFLDPAGKQILAETPSGRALEPARVQEAQTFHARQQWQENPAEDLNTSPTAMGVVVCLRMRRNPSCSSAGTVSSIQKRRCGSSARPRRPASMGVSR